MAIPSGSLHDNLRNATRTTGTLPETAIAVVDTDGSSLASVQLFTIPYDAITATYPSATQEVYQSRVGGIAGVVQETVTVNYTDATKEFILNLART